MRSTTPHFLLYTDYENTDNEGRWHVVLESVSGEEHFEAASEEDFVGERLELLAVVRGLEALNQPSRVTLVTPSRYVSRGIKFGLEHWRSSGWRWESFGVYVPVKNGDLWQRVDQALKIHDVTCRRWRIDQDHLQEGSESESAAVPDTQVA